MSEPQISERKDRTGAATMLQLLESKECSACAEGAWWSDVETWADIQVDADQAEEVYLM